MSLLHYFLPEWIESTDHREVVDVCIYGGTSAGLIAAVELRRRGKSVVVLQPGKFVGGLTSGGLGWTDYGRKHGIGGLSREFYRRVGRHYGKEEEFQFEPHVAAAVYSLMLEEHQVSFHLCQYLDRIEKQGGQIVAVQMLGGLRVEANIFIDATYEGDLLAAAGVSHIVGRESNAVYGETLNGIQVQNKHQFTDPVDPFVRQGDAGSGLLPGIIDEDLSLSQGAGDHRVQAYCFRMCMTDDPILKIDWQKPERFDPRLYVLAGRWFRAGKDSYNDHLPPGDNGSAVPNKFDILPNKTPSGFFKTDTNNHGAVSSDFIGFNYQWPQASYAQREAIFQAHVAYQQGYYWFVANDSQIPQRYRTAYSRWGLPKDEFPDTAHWPHQLYVREARRMVADYVITELDCRGNAHVTDSVGVGSYGMDSHNCSRFVKRTSGGAQVLNEGDVQVPAEQYCIPYRAIVPSPKQCTNLIVPVCLSASHIAYGSARMEPVFMVLGQSAAAAASLAIDGKTAVQDIAIAQLQRELLRAYQILEPPA